MKLHLSFLLKGMYMASTLPVLAQDDIIRQIDLKGTASLSVNQTTGKQVLRKHSIPTEPQPFEATEILITSMPGGEFCLTGYKKNPHGMIIKGFRIVCYQDDENNLVVKPRARRERVTGQPFN
jgi:hypothetical protein